MLNEEVVAAKVTRGRLTSAAAYLCESSFSLVKRDARARPAALR